MPVQSHWVCSLGSSLPFLTVYPLSKHSPGFLAVVSALAPNPNPNPDPNPNSPPAPDQVDRLVADMPMLRKTYGKMVYELRPSVDWHKGTAVEWLMEQFSKNSSEVRGRDRGMGRARIYVQREDILAL